MKANKYILTVFDVKKMPYTNQIISFTLHMCYSYYKIPSNISTMTVPGEEGGGPPVVVHLEEGLRQGARLVQRCPQRWV